MVVVRAGGGGGGGAGRWWCMVVVRAGAGVWCNTLLFIHTNDTSHYDKLITYVSLHHH